MEGTRRGSPFRVVITGGPCAGKTEVWRFLYAQIPDVVPVREAATELILSGCGPERMGQEAFQRAVFERQQALEDEALGKGSLLLCDRGLADGLAYCPALFQALKISAEQLLARYAVVIQLAVIDDPVIYASHSRSNPARTEEHSRALALEEAIRRIYGGHPSYCFVRGSLEDKKRSALLWIRNRIRILRPDLASSPYGPAHA